MLEVFFDVRGPILIKFLEHAQTMNSDVYSVTYARNIKSKPPGLLTARVVLHNGNARPHFSRVTQSLLAMFKWEQLGHPPYRPDMSPCDFKLFCPLKKNLKGKRFSSDELKDTVEN